MWGFFLFVALSASRTGIPEKYVIDHLCPLCMLSCLLIFFLSDCSCWGSPKCCKHFLKFCIQSAHCIICPRFILFCSFSFSSCHFVDEHTVIFPTLPLFWITVLKFRLRCLIPHLPSSWRKPYCLPPHISPLWLCLPVTLTDVYCSLASHLVPSLSTLLSISLSRPHINTSLSPAALTKEMYFLVSQLPTTSTLSSLTSCFSSISQFSV